MKKRDGAKVVVLGLFLCAGGAWAEEAQMGPTGFLLPDGNAARGRAAFRSLHCASCHRVAADLDLPKPVNETPAPALSFGSSTDNAVIAQSILSPSHTIAYGYGQGDPEDPQISPMIDLTDEMTVRQMIDIVAYLKSDPAPAASKTSKILETNQ
jgi:mono/diheme cytochrome c family protein